MGQKNAVNNRSLKNKVQEIWDSFQNDEKTRSKLCEKKNIYIYEIIAHVLRWYQQTTGSN